jgi:hypothetical protein
LTLKVTIARRISAVKVFFVSYIGCWTYWLNAERQRTQAELENETCFHSHRNSFCIPSVVVALFFWSAFVSITAASGSALNTCEEHICSPRDAAGSRTPHTVSLAQRCPQNIRFGFSHVPFPAPRISLHSHSLLKEVITSAIGEF